MIGLRYAAQCGTLHHTLDAAWAVVVAVTVACLAVGIVLHLRNVRDERRHESRYAPLRIGGTVEDHARRVA